MTSHVKFYSKDRDPYKYYFNDRWVKIFTSSITMWIKMLSNTTFNNNKNKNKTNIFLSFSQFI